MADGDIRGFSMDAMESISPYSTFAQQQKCLRGEHDPEPLVLWRVYDKPEDDFHRVALHVRCCRHCRCLFGEKP